jgi:hypothetical protein
MCLLHVALLASELAGWLTSTMDVLQSWSEHGTRRACYRQGRRTCTAVEGLAAWQLDARRASDYAWTARARERHALQGCGKQGCSQVCRRRLPALTCQSGEAGLEAGPPAADLVMRCGRASH